ncbi:hypothetical protein PR048_016244 [Dryococelus australis]|uniref:Uncharacterized protein n=1 Tax=Dryococelus australis TaxID=614101 RepID=A0ABQ9HJ73_9NEOP|nr:hypothetical protein PR048_016244 [Dryococelus australis]
MIVILPDDADAVALTSDEENFHGNGAVNKQSYVRRVDVSHVWFPHGGATAHAARASKTVVWRIFPQHVISSFGDAP